MALDTKIKPLKLKKHALNVYLNLMKLHLDQAQLLIIILKTKMFIRNIPGNKSYAQAPVPSNSARTSKNIVIFGDSIVNFSTKLTYNINGALTNGRARFKYFPGATSTKLLHYIDATLEESNSEVAVIHVGVNDLLNSNYSVDKLLENIIVW